MGQRYGPESDTALQLARVLKLGNTYEAQLRGSILQRRNQPEALLEQQALTIEGETLSRAIHTDLKALEQGLSRQFDTDLRSMLSNIGGVEKSQTWLTIASLVVFSFTCFAVFFEIRQRLVLQRSLADANENLERKSAGTHGRIHRRGVALSPTGGPVRRRDHSLRR